MRQREWVASKFGDCPVREEVIGLQYRSSEHHVQEFISGLSPQHRASLAAFCYGRAHLHEIGLTIAATCEFEELVAVAGSAGHFLFWQSRELSSERKPVAVSKQMNVTGKPSAGPMTLWFSICATEGVRRSASSACLRRVGILREPQRRPSNDRGCVPRPRPSHVRILADGVKA
jgi:hypothetical protein